MDSRRSGRRGGDGRRLNTLQFLLDIIHTDYYGEPTIVECRRVDGYDADLGLGAGPWPSEAVVRKLVGVGKKSDKRLPDDGVVMPVDPLLPSAEAPEDVFSEDSTASELGLAPIGAERVDPLDASFGSFMFLNVSEIREYALGLPCAAAGCCSDDIEGCLQRG